jgi:hypothetical protein
MKTAEDSSPAISAIEVRRFMMSLLMCVSRWAGKSLTGLAADEIGLLRYPRGGVGYQPPLAAAFCENVRLVGGRADRLARLRFARGVRDSH